MHIFDTFSSDSHLGKGIWKYSIKVKAPVPSGSCLGFLVCQGMCQYVIEKNQVDIGLILTILQSCHSKVQLKETSLFHHESISVIKKILFLSAERRSCLKRNSKDLHLCTLQQAKLDIPKPTETARRTKAGTLDESPAKRSSCSKHVPHEK